MGVYDFIPTEPAEGACAVEVLQGCPEVLALPVIDEAADEGLLKSSETSQVRQVAYSELPLSPGPQAGHPAQKLRYLAWSLMCPGKWGCLRAHRISGLPLVPIFLCLGHAAQTCTHPSPSLP